MSLFDEHQWVNQRQKGETEPGLSRRSFLCHGLTLGLASGPVASWLTACSEGKSKSGRTPPASVEVLNAWQGEEQRQASFQAVLAPFTE
jgi:hypothetical protein